MGGNSSKEKETKPKVQELSEETVNLLTQSTSLNKPTILNWHKQFIVIQTLEKSFFVFDFLLYLFLLGRLSEW